MEDTFAAYLDATTGPMASTRSSTSTAPTASGAR
jgi:hypothetical protein